MVPADILNGTQRQSHGLLQIQQAVRQATPVLPTPLVGYRLPYGGFRNVPVTAMQYWAALPLLNLPEVNLTPGYLRNFLYSPPYGAA